MAQARPPASERTEDDESIAWTTALSGDGRQREDARARLHAFLLRAARSELLRRARAEADAPLDDLASSAADAALRAIERDLHAYHGQSRFTTWAAKFAVHEAGVALRVWAWRDRSVPPESVGLAHLVEPADGEVDSKTAERLSRARQVLTEDLTEHQRFVIVAVVLNQVPIDVLAKRLGTTRGALYQTLHETRLAVRRRLAQTPPNR